MKKKVRELTHPSPNSTCTSPVKYKPNKRVKKRKKDQESDVHHDLSQWEYVEDS